MVRARRSGKSGHQRQVRGLVDSEGAVEGAPVCPLWGLSAPTGVVHGSRTIGIELILSALD